MVAYLKAGPWVRTYSYYLRATQETKKEDSWSCPGAPELRWLILFPNQGLPLSSPLRKLKGNQPIPKNPTVHFAHLEEEDAGGNEDQESDDLSRIKEVMEEFMVHLARTVKDAQADEKCCYHCSSPEHFICNYLLIETLGEKNQLNGKEGTVSKKGAQMPLTTANALRSPRQRFSKHKGPQQTAFLNPDPFQHWHVVKNVARVRINEESCMALLDNGTQISTIMPKYVSDHSLQMGLITILLGAKVACVGWVMPKWDL